ncbi:unnamed protein product [Jaminaea pallidilutea]
MTARGQHGDDRDEAQESPASSFAALRSRFEQLAAVGEPQSPQKSPGSSLSSVTSSPSPRQGNAVVETAPDSLPDAMRCARPTTIGGSESHEVPIRRRPPPARPPKPTPGASSSEGERNSSIRTLEHAASRDVLAKSFQSSVPASVVDPRVPRPLAASPTPGKALAITRSSQTPAHEAQAPSGSSDYLAAVSASPVHGRSPQLSTSPLVPPPPMRGPAILPSTPHTSASLAQAQKPASKPSTPSTHASKEAATIHSELKPASQPFKVAPPLLRSSAAKQAPVNHPQRDDQGLLGVDGQRRATLRASHPSLTGNGRSISETEVNSGNRNLHCRVKASPQPASTPATPPATSDEGKKPENALASETLPDASRANRRPPVYSPPHRVAAKSFSVFAQCGHTICTGSGDKVHVYRVGPTARPGDADKLCSLVAEAQGGGGKEVKITSMAFRPAAGSHEDEGRYLWCGTKDGQLWEMDIAQAMVTEVRTNVHASAVTMLRRAHSCLISVDAAGKICLWQPTEDGQPINLSQQPITQRMAAAKDSVALVLGTQLWQCSGSSSAAGGSALTSSSSPSKTAGHNSHTGVIGSALHIPVAASAAVAAAGFVSHTAANDHGPTSSSAAGPRLKVFNVLSTDLPFNVTSRPLTIEPAPKGGIGAVTCGTLLQSDPTRVFLGHDCGRISIWDRSSLTCIGTQWLSTLGFTALVGVGPFLWAGNRSGRISVYRPSLTPEHPWEVLKTWSAHKGAVASLHVDETALNHPEKQTLPVVSSGIDHCINFWDGTLAADFTTYRLSKRKAEYSSESPLTSLLVTFNVDAASPQALSSSVTAMEWLPQVLQSAGSAPGILHFGLQEVVDLEDKSLTAKSMLMSAARGGSTSGKGSSGEKSSHHYRLWQERLTQSIRLAMPPESPYIIAATEALVGLFSCTFVRLDLWPRVGSTATATVKTGLGGRWGNKGAIVSRLVVDDTSICFVNAHLAAGQKHVRQRNADLSQILEAEITRPTALEPSDAGADEQSSSAFLGGGNGELILDHEIVFLGGDLNYRIDLPRSQTLSCIEANDFKTLRAKDQLLCELMRNSPSFRLRGFKEAAQLDFAPTYKFDRNMQRYDTSEKQRVPAWCDRLLFRDALGEDSDGNVLRDTKTAATAAASPRVRCSQYRSWPELTISDHRPVSAVFQFHSKIVDAAKREQVRCQEEAKGQERVEAMLKEARQFYFAKEV